MTYEEIIKTVEELKATKGLTIRTERELRKISPESDQKELDRFVRITHIDRLAKPADPDMLAWQEYGHLMRIMNSHDEDYTLDEAMMIVATGSEGEVDRYEAEKQEYLAKVSAKMKELEPAAERWAKFTGASSLGASYGR
jgi:hypothetical protein